MSQELNETDLDYAVRLQYGGRIVPYDAPEPGPLDRRGLYNLAAMMFSPKCGLKGPDGYLVAPLHTVPADLFELDRGTKANKSDWKVRWEVRLLRIRMSEQGTLSADPPVGATQVMESWLTRLDEQFALLRSEQPTASWRVAGVLVRQQNSGKVSVIRDAEGGRSLGGMDPASLVARFGGVWPANDRTMPSGRGQVAVVPVHDRILEMALVVYDDAKTVLLDPNRAHGQDTAASPFARYAETRMLGDMPAAMLRERNEAERVWATLQQAVEESRPKLEASDDEVASLVRSMSVERAAAVLGVGAAEVKAAALRAAAAKKAKPEVTP